MSSLLKQNVSYFLLLLLVFCSGIAFHSFKNNTGQEVILSKQSQKNSGALSELKSITENYPDNTEQLENFSKTHSGDLLVYNEKDQSLEFWNISQNNPSSGYKEINTESKNRADLIVESPDRNFLFYFDINSESQGKDKFVWSYSKYVQLLFFLIFGLMILFASILLTKLSRLLKSKSGIPSFMILGLLVICTKFVLYLVPLEAIFSSISLFSNTSSPVLWNHSMAFLLLDIFFLAIIILEGYKESSTFEIQRITTNKYGLFSISILGNLIIVFSYLAFIYLIKSIVNHTNLYFDFENIINLNNYIFVALFGIGILIFSLLILSYRIISILNQLPIHLSQKLLSLIISIAISFPLYKFLSLDINWWYFVLIIVGIIFLIDIFYESEKKRFSWMVSWIVLLTLLSAVVIFIHNQKRTISIAKEESQNIISEISPKIQLAQESLLRLEADSILQKIVPELGIEVNTFAFANQVSKILNLTGLTLSGISVPGNSLFHNFYKSQSGVTPIPYHQVTLVGEKDYLLKKHPSELLLKANFLSGNDNGDQLPIYLSAQFDSNLSDPDQISAGITYIGDETGLTYVETPMEKLRSDERIGFEQLRTIYKTEFDVSEEKLILQYAEERKGLMQPISLFSLVMFLYILLLLGITLVNTISPFLPKDFSFQFRGRPNLRTRIQMSFVFFILFAFFIIGQSTKVYFRNSFNKNEITRTDGKVTRILNDIRELQSEYDAHTLSKIISSKHRHSISIYKGPVLDTVYSYYGEDQSLNLLPYANFVELNDIQLSINKQDGQVTDIYTRVNNPNERTTLGIPYSLGQANGRSQLQEFMGTILNVYVFLLLIAISIAIAVANSITKPLIVLSERLKAIKLGKRNEKITWTNQDEIGELVSDYNMMVEKLDDSAKVLAITEREMAWREMAKQVAHEIKNPLTPMKLSIQYLQNSINKSPEEIKHLTQRVTQTLMEQISSLSDIASEFSSFGKMPEPTSSKIVINEVIASVHDLFRKRDDMDIQLYVPIEEIYVFADKNQLIRVFNNLIKNAIQAIPTNRRGKISIKLSKNDQYAVVTVSDNGTGIDDEMRDKVFIPNFTTKNSGTGLGLAICSNIIESLDGKIYFNTKKDVGTDFTVEVPLMRMDDNFFSYQTVELTD